jgi:hypothetical protein
MSGARWICDNCGRPVIEDDGVASGPWVNGAPTDVAPFWVHETDFIQCGGVRRGGCDEEETVLIPDRPDLRPIDMPMAEVFGSRDVILP